MKVYLAVVVHKTDISLFNTCLLRSFFLQIYKQISLNLIIKLKISFESYRHFVVVFGGETVELMSNAKKFISRQAKPPLPLSSLAQHHT